MELMDFPLIILDDSLCLSAVKLILRIEFGEPIGEILQDKEMESILFRGPIFSHDTFAFCRCGDSFSSLYDLLIHFSSCHGLDPEEAIKWLKDGITAGLNLPLELEGNSWKVWIHSRQLSTHNLLSEIKKDFNERLDEENDRDTNRAIRGRDFTRDYGLILT